MPQLCHVFCTIPYHTAFEFWQIKIQQPVPHSSTFKSITRTRVPTQDNRRDSSRYSVSTPISLERGRYRTSRSCCRFSIPSRWYIRKARSRAVFLDASTAIVRICRWVGKSGTASNAVQTWNRGRRPSKPITMPETNRGQVKHVSRVRDNSQQTVSLVQCDEYHGCISLSSLPLTLFWLLLWHKP